MIMVGRFIYNILILVPYFSVGIVYKYLEGIQLWLPMISLLAQEIPAFFLTLFIYIYKSKSVELPKSIDLEF